MVLAERSKKRGGTYAGTESSGGERYNFPAANIRERVRPILASFVHRLGEGK